MHFKAFNWFLNKTSKFIRNFSRNVTDTESPFQLSFKQVQMPIQIQHISVGKIKQNKPLT